MRVHFEVLVVLLVVSFHLGAAEPKRGGFGRGGFGWGRGRASSSGTGKKHGTSDRQSMTAMAHVPSAPASSSVSRSVHNSVPNAPPPAQPRPNLSASAPNGPPPPYSASKTVHNSAPNDPPPAYSPSHSAPPSYSAATGTGSHASANYPRQNYGGVNGGAYTGGAYSGYNSGPHMYQQPAPGYGNGGHFGSPYGGGGYGYPMGSPSFGSPYGGGMMSSPYGNQQRSFSPIMGNVLTGLAVWQLARGFGGSHHNTQHVYHHYDNQNQQPAQPQSALTSVNGQPAQVTDLEGAHIDPKSISAGIEHTTDSVKLAEYPTPQPEADFPFAFTTIHPSLFPYGRNSDSLDYWANSHTKILNTAPAETIDSSTSSLEPMTSTTSPPTTGQLTNEQSKAILTDIFPN